MSNDQKKKRPAFQATEPSGKTAENRKREPAFQAIEASGAINATRKEKS